MNAYTLLSLSRPGIVRAFDRALVGSVDAIGWILAGGEGNMIEARALDTEIADSIEAIELCDPDEL